MPHPTPEEVCADCGFEEDHGLTCKYYKPRPAPMPEPNKEGWEAEIMNLDMDYDEKWNAEKNKEYTITCKIPELKKFISQAIASEKASWIKEAKKQIRDRSNDPSLSYILRSSWYHNYFDILALPIFTLPPKE